MVYLAVHSFAEATENQDMLDKVMLAATQLNNGAASSTVAASQVPSGQRFDTMASLSRGFANQREAREAGALAAAHSERDDVDVEAAEERGDTGQYAR